MTYDDPKALGFFVQRFPKILDKKLCQYIIDHHLEDKDGWKDGRMQSDDGLNVDEEVRKCSVYNIENDQCLNIVMPAMTKMVNDYMGIVKDAGTMPPRIQQVERPCLLHYKKGDFLKEHNDSGIENPRVLSTILNLSDDHDGGLFTFFNGEMEIKLEAGEGLVFPSCFTFPHAVTEVTRGERFSIITWLH